MDYIDCINDCLLPKLSKNLEECDDHPEFAIRINNLNLNFHKLLKLMGDLDFQYQSDISPCLLSAIFILNLELQSDGPWHVEKCKDCSEQLNHIFELNYGFKLDNLLMYSEIIKTQDIFDNCINYLHRKLTSSDFKKHPGLVDVYYRILEKVKEYNIALNPVSVLPISMFLIDDCVITNKVKGLKCCLSVLECLTTSAFQNGNYYEVIYVCLTKSILEKNIEVTNLTLACLEKLIIILPENVKISKTDDMYRIILDQLYSESNLYRKAVCFSFTKNLIEMHGVNCTKRKIFKTIMCDALDTCTNSAVAEILLQDTLECLQAWLKHCWCVWKLSTDHDMLSKLLKLLHVVCKNETAPLVQNLIMTLITLCTKEEQKQICKSFEMACQINRVCPEFLHILEIISTSICV